MRAGLRANRHEEIPDRTEAIRKAVKLAAAGDIVLIAGKGHETYQEFADKKIPFDDSAVARRAIEERRVEIEEDDDRERATIATRRHVFSPVIETLEGALIVDALTLIEIADMCGGVLHADSPSRTVRRISKDTRTLIPGDLYLALRGENHDGNVYAKDAAAKGAAGAILDAAACRTFPQDFPVILVDDSLAALHRLAAAWRDRLALKVACITGSSGKTSTKEFTAAVLSVRYRVVKTEGNLNNHIGLPLSILSASISDDAAVWEIGMNHPGEIAPLARLARPDLAIITNIGVAHIEYMGSREAIAAEKGALAEAVGSSGAVILSAEDDFASQIASRTTARVVRTGLSSGALTASNIAMSAEGCRFTIHAGNEVRPAPACPLRASTWCATRCSRSRRASSSVFDWKNAPKASPPPASRADD